MDSHSEHTPKRFRGLNARQRYKREYRECRMYNTYKRPEDLAFMKSLGDVARLNAFLSWCMRPERTEDESTN